MTHKYGRTDANQSTIVDALRKIGATVEIISDLGDGRPDLLVGYRGQNFLLEVKDGRKPPSARKLTPKEQTFFETWRGSVHIVYSEIDAVTLVNHITVVDDGVPF